MADFIVDLNAELVRYSLEAEEKAFHQALHDNPRDHTTPLVYADWLEEQGQAGVAEIIRRHMKRQPEKDATYDHPHEVQARATNLQNLREEVHTVRRESAAYRGEDPNSVPFPDDIVHPVYSVNGDHTGADKLNIFADGSDRKVSIRGKVLPSPSVAVRSKANPDRWFHWMGGMTPDEEAAKLKEQLAKDGTPTEHR